MQGFWWKLPLLRDLSPVRKGAMESVPVILGSTFILAGVAWLAEIRPTEGTLQSSAQVGATLLIAYVVEVSWVVRAARRRPAEERESRLGAFVGLGTAGGVGVALSLALGERAHAQHWIWLDDLGLGWVAASLLCLGLMIALQPWIIHEWMNEDEST